MRRGIGRLRAGAGVVAVTPPAAFGWTPTVNITRSAAGIYTTDYDPTPFLVEGAPGVTTYYVDGDTGNDANPGTSASPKKSLVGVSAGRVTKLLIKARGTFYIGITGPVQMGHDNLCVEAWGGAACNITTLASPTGGFPLVWTNEGGGVWSAPPPFSSFNGIAPYLGTDMETLVKYPLAASLAACQATAGTYFRDLSSGIKHYVHTTTGVSPDVGHTVFAANGAAQGYSSDSFAFDQRIAFHGVTFLGGSTAMRASGTSIYTKRIDFVNCAFKHASSTGAAFCSGTVAPTYYNCTAGPTDFDGFSCSTASGAADGTEVPKSIEIGCTGYSCGITGGGGANQGSTTHFGGKSVRVNCHYYDTTNDQVADVGEGTRSWNLGVLVGPKRSGTTTYAGFHAGESTEDIRMWLDGCTFSGVSYEVAATSGATIYYRNMPAPVVDSTYTGTVTTY